MRDFSKNPLLDWWREHDFEPRLINQADKIPPTMSAPVTDEDYLIALSVGLGAVKGWYDRKALKNGSARFTLRYKLTKALNILVTTLGFLIFPAAWYFFRLEAGLILFFTLSEVIIMAIPIMWLINHVRFLNLGALKAGPVVLVSLGMSTAIFLFGLTMAHRLNNGLLNMPGFLKTSLMVLPSEIILVVILMCYAIRALKQITHERRMET